MTGHEFDQALIAAALDRAARFGWAAVRVDAAARQAGLDQARARFRFPHRAAILMGLGAQLDRAALAEPSHEPDLRARLFDLLMRRFDAMQPYRAGIAAILRELPCHPALGLLLAAATRCGMGRVLDAAGAPPVGVSGQARVARLVGVWLYAARAWAVDRSADLSGTMAALDRGLDRAGL